MVKLNGLVVLTELPPPPEKLPPAPPVNEPRFISELPLNNEKADIVPVVVPPIPVEAPLLGPTGLVKPLSVKVSVSDPAPVFVKRMESKSRNADDAVPGALDAPDAIRADQEPTPPLKPIAPNVGSLSPGALSVMVTLVLDTLSVNVRINVAWAEVAHNANAPAASVAVTSFLMVIFMA